MVWQKVRDKRWPQPHVSPHGSAVFFRAGFMPLKFLLLGLAHRRKRAPAMVFGVVTLL